MPDKSEERSSGTGHDDLARLTSCGWCEISPLFAQRGKKRVARGNQDVKDKNERKGLSETHPSSRSFGQGASARHQNATKTGLLASLVGMGARRPPSKGYTALRTTSRGLHLHHPAEAAGGISEGEDFHVGPKQCPISGSQVEKRKLRKSPEGRTNGGRPG